MSETIWQDVEYGSYVADLPLWEKLAGAADGPLLELGCGSGRVALHLARRGHRVTGLDLDADLVAELRRRAAAAGLATDGATADAAGFALGARFALIIAPMQLIQLLPGTQGRLRCLRCIRAHLAPGGRAALAFVEEVAEGIAPSSTLPDVKELDGWVYSSRPLGLRRENGAYVMDLLRQRVSPDGRLTDEAAAVRLTQVSAAELEAEARKAGLRPAGRARIEADDEHVRSEVLLLEEA
jgi:SAM-dependent methyltransferase